MTVFGKPARPLAYFLVESEARFQDKNIHGGDLLFVDPDQPGEAGDVVLVALPDRLSFRRYGEQAEGQVIGPVVWVQPPGFEPDDPAAAR